MASSGDSGVDELIKDAKLMYADFIVIAIYFLAVIGVGVWVSKSYHVKFLYYSLLLL